MKLFVSRNLLIGGLLVSLGVNMFLAGLALSRLRPPPPINPMRMVDHIADQLPPADAAILREAVETRRVGMMEEELKMRTFPERLRAALQAEPFDPSAFAAVFGEGCRRDSDFGSAMVEAAQKMSPEGRHRWAAVRP